MNCYDVRYRTIEGDVYQTDMLGSCVESIREDMEDIKRLDIKVEKTKLESVTVRTVIYRPYALIYPRGEFIFFATSDYHAALVAGDIADTIRLYDDMYSKSWS